MTSRKADLSAPVEQVGLGVVRAAWPVTAETHKALANVANWLVARGTPLVIDGRHRWPDDGTDTRTLNYRCWVDAAHPVLAVFMVLSSEYGTLSTLINGVPCVTTSVPTFLHYAMVQEVGNGELDLQFVFEPQGDDAPYPRVHNLYVYEAPLGSLPSSAGVDPPEPGTIIYDGASVRASISGLAAAAEELRTTYFRRGALFNWAVDENDTSQTQHTNTDDENLFGSWSDIRPAIQTRHMYNGETLREVKVAVYAKVTGGIGNVTVRMGGSTDVAAIVITHTSYAWESVNILVKTDDPSEWTTGMGIRDGRDTMLIEVSAQSGQSIFVAGISVYDVPGD